MKFVLAPDSFKESMTSYEAAIAMQKALLSHHHETILCPLSDGGEGTLDTLVRGLQGHIEYVEVTGPLFEKRKAPIGIVGDLAIIECAATCGIELLEESQKDPYHTTTYGLGQLMTYALDHHIARIMICLGGSSTNDGGIGKLSALGVRFYNAHHQEVALTMKGLCELDHIDFSHLDGRLKKTQIIGVCDVDNPLCGENGATYIYGPQKGVLDHEKAMIDNYMFNYGEKVDQYYQNDYMHAKGAGAAGGLGYALLSFCQAHLKSGFDIVAEVMQLEEKIKNCDIVFVGEGKIDQQTQFGKTPYGVLKIAQKYQKKVYAFAGKVEDE
ncbi:MAG: glycerate kinase, partial [Floccifex sp.]